MKYLKWVFGTNIANKDNEKFEIGKIITADTWDPYNDDWDKRGGFNFTNEECSLRWMSRGDTLYEVDLPSDAQLVEVKNDKTPGGIFIANKIILKNPISISDDLLFDFYKKSKLPLSTYFECIGLLASRGYYDIALKIIKDKVNQENIDMAIDKFKRALKPWHEGHIDYDIYKKVMEDLEEIKSSLLINRFIDKEPYVKKITDDKIINLTGESGSGKSYFSNKYINDPNYIVIDTDIVFGSDPSDNKKSLEIRKLFKNRSKDDLINDFDNCYDEILGYFKNSNKTVVIDSAQFRNMKDISKLKGKVIVMRTCIDTCYERCINRYNDKNPNASFEEKQKYVDRKKGMFSWYKSLNEFIKKVDDLKIKNINYDTKKAILDNSKDSKIYNFIGEVFRKLKK